LAASSTAALTALAVRVLIPPPRLCACACKRAWGVPACTCAVCCTCLHLPPSPAGPLPIPFNASATTMKELDTGIEGLRGLCHPKAVCEDRVPWLMSSSLPPPWQYPVQVRL